MPAVDFTTIQLILEFVGTAAFAISGALLAGRKHMDLGGVVVLGVLVAVGGGTIRDLLLGINPVVWVGNPVFVLFAAVVALATIPLTNVGAIKVIERHRLVTIFDAAGMALFVVSGTSTALSVGADWLSAVVIGVVTGIAGGIIRDVLANKIPYLLNSGEIYATAAFIGGLLHVALSQAGFSQLTALWVPVAVIFGIRLLAIRRNWSVPRFKVQDDDEGG
ncbi:trimeric intracellular cation channel family protein [Haloferax sp. DFSO52]|uniref:trimeric intracellular cation channel family protein n=1 Tax=Haloferax sp. DFSO52 TaxID=3388505 RepID=UPI003A8B95F7